MTDYKVRGFVTKDSGERQTFDSGMQRDSAQKDLRPDLCYQPMLARWQATPGRGESFIVERRLTAEACFCEWFNGTEALDADKQPIDFAAEALAAISDVETCKGGAPMLVRWAELMGRGAAKYGERNWEKACSEAELARFKASAFRHFVQWFYGLNPEEDHAAAVFFNISGAEYVKERIPKQLEAPAPAAAVIKRLVEREVAGDDLKGLAARECGAV
jgi:hypothetical protein